MARKNTLVQHWSKIQRELFDHGCMSIADVMARLGLCDKRYVKGILEAFTSLSGFVEFDGKEIRVKKIDSMTQTDTDSSKQGKYKLKLGEITDNNSDKIN